MICLRSRSAALRMVTITSVAMASNAIKTKVYIFQGNTPIHMGKYCFDIIIHLFSEVKHLLAPPASTSHCVHFFKLYDID